VAEIKITFRRTDELKVTLADDEVLNTKPDKYEQQYEMAKDILEAAAKLRRSQEKYLNTGAVCY
jgi:hypothetical protein